MCGVYYSVADVGMLEGGHVDEGRIDRYVDTWRREVYFAELLPPEKSKYLNVVLEIRIGCTYRPAFSSKRSIDSFFPMLLTVVVLSHKARL